MPSSNKQNRLSYQPAWEKRFGIAPTVRNVKTQEVETAVCLFCRRYGREDLAIGGHRRRTQRVKHFSLPWRVDHIDRHVCKQHPSKFKEYEEASIDV